MNRPYAPMDLSQVPVPHFDENPDYNKFLSTPFKKVKWPEREGLGGLRRIKVHGYSPPDASVAACICGSCCCSVCQHPRHPCLSMPHLALATGYPGQDVPVDWAERPRLHA
jgi:hypothetical protein